MARISHRLLQKFREMTQPMSVSKYRLLPKSVQDALPTPEQLKAELERAEQEVNE